MQLVPFQAVAREEKGAIGGVDWNKSPPAQFKTSIVQKKRKIAVMMSGADAGASGGPAPVVGVLSLAFLVFASLFKKY